MAKLFVYWRYGLWTPPNVLQGSKPLFSISLLQDSNRKWGITQVNPSFPSSFQLLCPRILLHLSNVRCSESAGPARRLQIVVQALFYSQRAFQRLQNSKNRIWRTHSKWGPDGIRPSNLNYHTKCKTVDWSGALRCLKTIEASDGSVGRAFWSIAAVKMPKGRFSSNLSEKDGG